MARRLQIELSYAALEGSIARGAAVAAKLGSRKEGRKESREGHSVCHGNEAVQESALGCASATPNTRPNPTVTLDAIFVGFVGFCRF
jgi:hypothetical protein